MAKKALGKGLEALLPKLKNSENDESKQNVIEVPLDSLAPNPHQPRKHFDQTHLDELADSIKQNGVLQPIIAQKEGDSFVIIVGERRVRASRIAGLKTVPALIKDFSEKNALQIALIENIQRENLNPIEEAYAFEEYMKQLNVTQEIMAKQVSKDRSVIANTLRLLKLPGQVKEYVRQGRLSAGHARNLLALQNEDEQLRVAETIITEAWTVRDVEKFVKQNKKTRRKKINKPAADKILEPNLLAVREQMVRVFGTKVSIVPQKKGGQIVIEYYDDDDLNRLIEMLLKK